jgi:hypothetical protein
MHYHGHNMQDFVDIAFPDIQALEIKRNTQGRERRDRIEWALR